MTRIKTILKGFVDINLETDEKSFMKSREDKIERQIQTNLIVSDKNIKSIEKTTSTNLTPPISLIEISEKINIQILDMQIAVVQGSNVHGDFTSNSDWDITIVLNSFVGYDFIEFTFEDIDYDIHLYGVEEFQNRLDRKEMKELEILSYPEEAFLLKNIEFKTLENKVQLVKKVREQSDVSWLRAKTLLESQENQYQALKGIWHSIRNLVFAEQILRFGTIKNLSSTNNLRTQIVNSGQLDFKFFEDNFGSLREQMKLELGRHIGEKNEEVSLIESMEPSELDSTIRLFTKVNLQGLYIQKGNRRVNVESRYIRRNTIGTSPDNTWDMFIRFGDYIEQDWRTFNPPITKNNSPVCGDNCITGYSPGLIDSFQKNSKIFFGKNPETQEYGDLRIRIKNLGTNTSNISGTTISPNESVTLIIDSFDYKILLPTNDTLLSAGTFFNGSILNQDTLTECNYEFIFEIDYSEFNFQLRNLDNTVSATKEFNLGVHRFNKVFKLSDAENPSNYYNLVTKYSNVWPYWESNYSWPNTGPYCMAPGTSMSPTPIYPTDQGDLQNITIDGIMFLSQTITNYNSASMNKSGYMNISFLSNGQTAASSGCTSVYIEKLITFGSQLQTTSIPFLVL